jgi:hypothetical protein
MSGLMYFNGCHSTEKEALLPNGTKRLRKYDIPPHYASIWVDSQDLDESQTHWWPGERKDRTLVFDIVAGITGTAYVSEFRIPEQANVTFPDKLDPPAQFDRFESALPMLQKIDDVFEVDLDTPDVIARVSIRGGKLRAYKFKRVASVKWTIDHPDDPMTVRANQYFITLKPQTSEIVFSNNSDLLAHGDQTPHHVDTYEDNHFYLYSRIEKDRDGTGLVIPGYSDNLEQLAYQHPYLIKLASILHLSDSGCTGTCC